MFVCSLAMIHTPIRQLRPTDRGRVRIRRRLMPKIGPASDQSDLLWIYGGSARG